MNYASTCEKLSMQPHWVYRTLPWSFSLPPVDVQLGWEAQPCRCNVPYFCRNCIDCDQQSKTVHDAFMQFMYHTCMATSWPKTKNLTIDLITPHNPLHKKNIGSRSKWKSLLKDLCNWLLCFSQWSVQKDQMKCTKKIIRSGPKCKSLSRIWNWSKSDPPIKHPKPPKSTLLSTVTTIVLWISQPGNSTLNVLLRRNHLLAIALKPSKNLKTLKPSRNLKP